jgi:hypothetical protein
MRFFDASRIAGDDIQTLVRNGEREGRDLDYKRDLPAPTNDGKKELLQDVTSFANATGGVIVFGVDESRDERGKPTGIPSQVFGLSGANLDSEMLRLGQWMRAGIEPRLPAHRFHVVDDIQPGPVLVLVIPRSWAGPHMVATADSRFYSRTSNGKYPLDVAEIRAAFLQREEIPARLRRFRDERLGLLIAGETPVQLQAGSRIVLHIVPLLAVEGRVPVDLAAWAKQSPLPLDGGLEGHHFNFDGHVACGVKAGDGHGSYVQLFRTGAIEAVSVHDYRAGGLPVMNIWHTEKLIVDGVKRYLPLLGTVGATTPVSISLSLVGARGCGLLASQNRPFLPRGVVTRDILTLPDASFESLDTDPPTGLRPVFDALWQTFGLPNSFCYDEAGNWDPNIKW